MGKRIDNARKAIKKDKLLNASIFDALSFFFGSYFNNYKAKHHETIEFILKLGIDTKQFGHLIKGAAIMPHSYGKDKRVLLIVEKSRIDEAKKTGAHLVGSDEIIDNIQSVLSDFDLCISTPKMMPQVSKIAKLLGPRGLMPNPKLGTVSDDIESTVKNVKKGRVQFAVDKAAIVHVPVARMNVNSIDNAKDNIMQLYSSIIACKPAKFKGVFVKGAFLSSTHGPSIKLDLKSFIV